MSQDTTELPTGKVKHAWAVQDAVGKFITSDEAMAPMRSFKL